jgi:VanZ family protein
MRHSAIMSLVPETSILDAEGNPRNPARRLWLIVSGAWIAVTLLSSTGLAAVYCSHAFVWLYGSTIGKHFTSHKAYDRLYFIAQKSLHLTLFFVLGVMLWQVFLVPAGRRLIFVVLAGLIVGASSEILQFYFPNHDPEITDVLINMVGTFLGAGACVWRGQRESAQKRIRPGAIHYRST